MLGKGRPALQLARMLFDTNMITPANHHTYTGVCDENRTIGFKLSKVLKTFALGRRCSVQLRLPQLQGYSDEVN